MTFVLKPRVKHKLWSIWSKVEVWFHLSGENASFTEDCLTCHSVERSTGANNRIRNSFSFRILVLCVSVSVSWLSHRRRYRRGVTGVFLPQNGLVWS